MNESKDEYLMLREEILHLSTLEDNIINLLYVIVVTAMAFSFAQKDTIYILLSYIVLIPTYRLVLSKEIGMYKIGSYLFVYHEGNEFNWEGRNLKFFDKFYKVHRRKLQAFNSPFLYISTFILLIFFIKTDWKSMFTIYELGKISIAVFFYVLLMSWIIKNRYMDIRRYISYWEEIRRDEVNSGHQ